MKTQEVTNEQASVCTYLYFFRLQDNLENKSVSKKLLARFSAFCRAL